MSSEHVEELVCRNSARTVSLIDYLVFIYSVCISLYSYAN